MRSASSACSPALPPNESERNRTVPRAAPPLDVSVRFHSIVQFLPRPKNETISRFVPFSTTLYQVLTTILRFLVSFSSQPVPLDESVRFTELVPIPALRSPFAPLRSIFRNSGFGILSSFGIRHSSFREAACSLT